MPPKTRQANQAKKGPVCGTESRMVAKEIVMYREDHRVIVAGRDFLCPKCDKIFQSMGHHSPCSVKTLKKKLP